jgi:hypothetical protein
LVATIFSDLDLHPRPLTIVARSGSNVVRFRYKAGRVARLTTPLESKAGVCRVTFTVPTAVPQQVIGNADTRALGVRFFGLAYVPRR